jgi:hypothetical protein
VDPEEFTSYVLVGLDMEYNSVVSVAVARVEPITPSELLTQMSPCVVVVVKAVVVVAAVGVAFSLEAADVVLVPTTTIEPNVSCVARLAMSSSSAGNDLITPTMVKRRWPM